MNSRLKQIRENPLHYNNSSEQRRNFKKRKYEEEESEPPRKRPFLIRDAPPLQHCSPEEANVQSWSRQPREQASEQPRRYSANNRLQNIRRSREVVQVPKYSPNHLQDKSPSDVASSSTSLQTASSPGVSYNQRRSFEGTAKPSSLQERLSKIKNSGSSNKLNRPRNDLRSRSQKLNTVGGGWYKSVDVEGKSNEDLQNKATTSSNVDARKSLQMTFTTDSRGPNRTRANRSADAAFFPSNNNSDKNNTAAFNDNNVSDFYGDLPLNNATYNSETTYSSSSVPTASIELTTQGDDMDWESSQEKEVVSNLQEMRRNTKIATAVPQTPFQETMAKKSKEIEHNTNVLKTVYIVVDTNIFLSHLETVKKAMKLRINGTSIGTVCPVILVPWIVIQELDHIKDGRHEYKLKNKAREAINFIHDCLCSKANLRGQSVRDAAQQDFSSSNFDDSILHCCLQIRERRNRAILLSNDVNLKNKLMNEDFETYSQHNIFKKLDPYHISFPNSSADVVIDLEKNEKIKGINTYLSHMCTFIILNELKSAYGDLWNKMGSTKKKLPWSLQDCLNLFEQYWRPVFQMNVPKHCLKHIETFNKYLKAHNGIASDVEKLFNFGLTLCIHLKAGYTFYFDTIGECIASMQKVYDGTD